jgi:pimeloyl-ACP methyl ester carboxylesterase
VTVKTELPPPPLARFEGARPPAPHWFEKAIATKPARSFTTVAGANIETLAWGEEGKPGIVLIHGGMAHADWWSFMAPLFAKTYRVAAFSLSGMGRSDWRPSYAIETFVEELFAVIAATGLDQAKTRPVVMGHSFGGLPTLAAGVERGRELGGVIMLDAPLLSPAERAAREQSRKPSRPPRDTRLYASETEALMRFRFQPPQTVEHPFIVDHIARHSLREVKAPDGSKGYTWRFDPFMWSRLQRRDPIADVPRLKCRSSIMWGNRSRLYSKATLAHLHEIAPAKTAFVEIPDAQHHVMVDQPIALVAAVRALMATWET